MAAALAQSSAVPFHLSLTEPIDETATAGYPAVEGAYDPVEQKWRLPDGMLLTDLPAAKVPFLISLTWSGTTPDDAHAE
jgi:hypothetical protein